MQVLVICTDYFKIIVKEKYFEGRVFGTKLDILVTS